MFHTEHLVIILSVVTIRHSPAQREEHARLEGLVIQPGGVLVDGDLGVEQDGHPLRDPRGGGPGTGEYSLVH